MGPSRKPAGTGTAKRRPASVDPGPAPKKKGRPRRGDEALEDAAAPRKRPPARKLAADVPAPAAGPWLANDGDDWYEPLLELRRGDHLEVIALVGKNVRHFTVRASGTAFTEDGFDGAFLDAEFVDVVEGAGGALLTKNLTGPRGTGLLHFCDGDRATCKVYSPDEGRILFHVDQYRLRPDMGGATPAPSVRGEPALVDPGAGAPLLDDGGPLSDGGEGGGRPDLTKRLGELKDRLRRGPLGRREGSGPSDAPALASVLADRARDHQKRLSAAPPGDDVRPRPGERRGLLAPGGHPADDDRDDAGHSSFRVAPPRASEDLASFARRFPGQLLQLAVEEIERFLSTRGGADAAGAAAPEARFLSYLVQVVHAHHPLRSWKTSDGR